MPDNSENEVMYSEAESTEEEWENFVEFIAPRGEAVRYVRSNAGLQEYVHLEDKWHKVGVATRLTFDPRTRALVDQRNAGGALPAHGLSTLLAKIAKLAESCNVPHNINMERILAATQQATKTKQDDDNFSISDGVSFTAPRGDNVKFMPTSQNALEEYILMPPGKWVLVGKATRLRYDPKSRAITDQRGAGGCLPKEGVSIILRRLRKLCEACGVPHNIPSAPPPATGFPLPRHLRKSQGEGLPILPTPGEPKSFHPPTGSLRPGGKALLVATSGPARSSLASDGCSQHLQWLSSFLKRRFPLPTQTLCDGKSGGLLTAEDIKRGVSWLVEGARPGDNLFLSLLGVGMPKRDPYDPPDTFFYAHGGPFTSHDFREYIMEQLPMGVRLTVLCDTSPPCNLIDLPFKLVANSEGGFDFGQKENSFPCPAQVVLISAENELRHPMTPLGVLTTALISVLDKDPNPTYVKLAHGLRSHLANQPHTDGLLPVISSNRSFDAMGENFSLTDWEVPLPASPSPPPSVRSNAPRVNRVTRPPPSRSAPLRDDFSPRYDTLDFADFDDTQRLYRGSSSNDSGSSAEDMVTLRDVLLDFYKKHNPVKLHLVPSLVEEFAGHSKQLLDLLSSKYHDPSILEVYNPAWDSRKPHHGFATTQSGPTAYDFM